MTENEKNKTNNRTISTSESDCGSYQKAALK